MHLSLLEVDLYLYAGIVQDSPRLITSSNDLRRMKQKVLTRWLVIKDDCRGKKCIYSQQWTANDEGGDPADNNGDVVLISKAEC